MSWKFRNSSITEAPGWPSCTWMHLSAYNKIKLLNVVETGSKSKLIQTIKMYKFKSKWNETKAGLFIYSLAVLPLYWLKKSLIVNLIFNVKVKTFLQMNQFGGSLSVSSELPGVSLTVVLLWSFDLWRTRVFQHLQRSRRFFKHLIETHESAKAKHLLMKLVFFMKLSEFSPLWDRCVYLILK